MNQNKSEVIVLTPDKIDFREQNIARDKEGHFRKVKGKIHQEDKTNLNTYVLRNRALIT